MPDSLLSRTANPDRMFGEVRAICPVEVIAVIDAVCVAEPDSDGKAKAREKKVREILREWAIREARRASLIQRVTKGIPDIAEMTSDSGFGEL